MHIFIYDNMYVFSLFLYTYIYCVILHYTPYNKTSEVEVYIDINAQKWISRFFPLFSFLFHSSFLSTTLVFIIIIIYGGDDYYKCMTVEEIVQCASRANTHVTLWRSRLQVGGGVAKKRVSSSFIIIVCYIILYMCV